MPRRQSSARKRNVSKGWDAFATPVPGDVLAAMEELGVSVIRVNGDEAQAKCPAHLKRTGKEDKHPSFSVNVEEGFFNCFSCGYRGPFVLLAEDMLCVERDEAVGWVRARGGIERARRTLEEHASGNKIVVRDTTLQMNEATLALFVDPPAEALEKRGLSLESAQYFGVRWDADKDRWITPIRDPDTDKLWGYQAKNERYFNNFPKDIKKSKTLFGLGQLESWSNSVILVESPLDVLRLFTADQVGGLSSFGAGVSEIQMDLIKNVAEILYVGLDNDKDGSKYSQWIRDNYRNCGLNIKFLNYADFDEDIKDPGDMTDEQINYAIATAIPSMQVVF